jgi:hypothetical protein
VRFLNEAEAIARAGGFVVKLIRPRVGLRGDAANHASESDFEKPEAEQWISAVVENDGSLKDLEMKVERVLKHFGL